MALQPMHRNDEDPAWIATVTVNGTALDYSTGYTFTVYLQKAGANVLTKTTGITGAAAGVITTTWAVGDIDLAPGLYTTLLVIRRTSDSREHTVQESLSVVARA